MSKQTGIEISGWFYIISFFFWPIVGFFVMRIMANPTAYHERKAKRKQFYFNQRWKILKVIYFLPAWIDLNAKNTDIEEPIRGYKQALLLYDFDLRSLEFKPITNRLNYLAIDTARCYRYPHDSPNDSCKCGFHGLRFKGLVGKAMGSFTSSSRSMQKYLPAQLEIELYGSTIEGLYGFRAQKQRVLRVNIARKCSVCNIAKNILFVRRKIKLCLIVVAYHNNSYVCVTPLCLNHSRYKNQNETFSLQDIADKLGTEVALR